MVTRTQIQEEVRTWLGLKWRHQGRSRCCGVDCAGLILEVGKELGLLPLDYDEQGYGRRALGYDFIQVFRNRPELVSVDTLNPAVGDILVFADNSYPCHCGITTSKHGSTYFVHAHAAHKKVIEEKYPWVRGANRPTLAVAAFRFIGVTE